MELMGEEDTERCLGGPRAKTHCFGLWLLELLVWWPSVGFLAPRPAAFWLLFCNNLSVYACSLGDAHKLSPAIKLRAQHLLPALLLSTPGFSQGGGIGLQLTLSLY